MHSTGQEDSQSRDTHRNSAQAMEQTVCIETFVQGINNHVSRALVPDKLDQIILAFIGCWLSVEKTCWITSAALRQWVALG